MIYLSEIIGSQVWDAFGNNFGKCIDILIARWKLPSRRCLR